MVQWQSPLPTHTIQEYYYLKVFTINCPSGNSTDSSPNSKWDSTSGVEGSIVARCTDPGTRNNVNMIIIYILIQLTLAIGCNSITLTTYKHAHYTYLLHPYILYTNSKISGCKLNYDKHVKAQETEPNFRSAKYVRLFMRYPVCKCKYKMPQNTHNDVAFQQSHKLSYLYSWTLAVVVNIMSHEAEIICYDVIMNGETEKDPMTCESSFRLLMFHAFISMTAKRCLINDEICMSKPLRSDQYILYSSIIFFWDLFHCSRS